MNKLLDSIFLACNLDPLPSSQLPVARVCQVSLLPGLALTRSPKMAEKIAIDKTNFFNHLSNLYASWKADKRSGNALFGGADSMVILMGKTKTDESSFQKNNAMHVSHPLSKPGFAL